MQFLTFLILLLLLHSARLPMCEPLWWASLCDTFRKCFSFTGEQKKGSNGQQEVVRKYLAWRRSTFFNVP